MDRFIQNYLIDARKQIERRNAYSDNKKFHIKSERQEVLQWLIDAKQIEPSDIPQVKKILGIR